MNERIEQQRAKKILEEELTSLQFTKQQKVLSQTHPKTLKEKLVQLWNKEVTIPLIPLGAVVLLFLSFGSFAAISEIDMEGSRVIVEKGGSFYWQDLLEEGKSE